jgi:hypothetical protein
MLEYQDYINHRDLILNKTNNGNFTAMDSGNQIWYLIHNGESKPLEKSSEELENVQLSIVYYTDIFSGFPDAKLYTMGATALATITTAFAMILAFVYMCNTMHDQTNHDIMFSLKDRRYLSLFLCLQYFQEPSSAVFW